MLQRRARARLRGRRSRLPGRDDRSLRPGPAHDVARERSRRFRGKPAARSRIRRPRLLRGGHPRVLRGGRPAVRGGLERPGVVRRPGDPSSLRAPPERAQRRRHDPGHHLPVRGPAAGGRPSPLLQPLDHAARSAASLRHPLLRRPGAPKPRSLLHDDGEVVASEWVVPAEALARHRAGELDLMFPTVKHLESLSRFSSRARALERGADARSRSYSPGSASTVPTSGSCCRATLASTMPLVCRTGMVFPDRPLGVGDG